MGWSDNIEGMLGRMTPRERRLFGVLAIAVGLVIIGGVAVGITAFFSSLQEELDRERQVLAEMRALAPTYRDLNERKRQMEEAIRNNRSTARLMVNEILKKQELSEEVPGATGGTLADIVTFEGKTSETPIEPGRGARKKASAKAKGRESGGLVEIEQSLDFKEVPVADLLVFLDQVERSKDLIFVTKLEMTRKFNNLSHVRAQCSVVTYQYQGTETPAGP